ncbi:MAG: 2,3-bisphosphoglycerate-independent phosphoglycerate mutase [Lachnospiraceae bacterium]|nr:2,3-bisphosphoglycerate-independent phosphoglycerate mutase [Lachnospiraceae bacterium]
MKKPVVLMILDGYGLSDDPEGNAIYMANTPVVDRLKKEYPFVKGYASGLAVGLPDGQMGNSEVGHLNMGAGRVVYQDLTRITKSIEDGDFFEKKELLDAIDNCLKNGSDLHVYGLLSDGGVHSDNHHMYAVLDLCKRKGLDRVYIHCFMDGRDTSPTSGIGYVKELLEQTEKFETGKIATITGRYYAMDRDNRWERVERAYNALTKGEGIKESCPVKAMENSYAKEVTDEFIEPTVIVKENGEPTAVIKDGDSVIFINFRPDRAREISRTFCCDDFDGFARGERIKTEYVCFTEYDVTIPNKKVVFKEEEIVNTFGEYLASKGLKQARIAETEKYAHVTFFFNGGVEKPNEGEDRFLIPSPKVATYDLQPEMSAPEVCETLIKVIKEGKHDVIIINFANPDMVGHTGIIPAVVKAIETIDECVGKVVDVIKEEDAVMFLCADHGNAEMNINHETKEPWTAHTTNPVPFILINGPEGVGLKEGGRLCDIAPTLLELLEIEQPKEMTGESLLIK